MIEKLQNPKRAERLFGKWQEAIIWSCLQNVMGAVYADHSENPKSAMALSGDFCFLAGQPDRELVRYKPEGCRQDFMIMVPQNDQWAEVIRDIYGERARAVTRYAIKKDTCFDRERLQAAVGSLSPGFTMKMINQDCFELCKNSGWTHDLVSQYPDYTMYEKLGIGAAVFKGEEIVSGASAYVRYREGIEIEIDTKENYRRMGLAYACGAKLILECLEQGLYPSWDAQNKWSVALAQKLGYQFDYEYPAYEITQYAG